MSRSLNFLSSVLPNQRVANFTPSKEQIAAVINDIANAKKHPFDTVVNLGDGRCVKRGPGVTVREAKAQEFVRNNTSIPVPQALLAFEYEDWGYIVMDTVKGDSLETVCHNMGEEQLSSIATQRKGYVDQLQRFKHVLSNNQLGSWPDGPYRNVFFRQLPSEKDISLPLPTTIKEFHQYWSQRSGKPHLLDMADGASCMFTHGDLNMRNILIGNGKIVGILDWETLGWYPDFWESMIMRRSALWCKGWDMAIQNVFGQAADVEELYWKTLDIVFSDD